MVLQNPFGNQRTETCGDGGCVRSVSLFNMLSVFLKPVRFLRYISKIQKKKVAMKLFLQKKVYDGNVPGSKREVQR